MTVYECAPLKRYLLGSKRIHYYSNSSMWQLVLMFHPAQDQKTGPGMMHSTQGQSLPLNKSCFLPDLDLFQSRDMVSLKLS
jgi:hypothetical protein